MVAALGVNQKWLFTSVFALGVFLAALGGALQIPRDAVHHALDLRIIVDVFVVVVIGGLGSIIGAFVAAVLVSELNAFGILIFPKISIILVFLVMAVVLIVRPWGLFGKPEAAARRTPGLTVNPWRPLTSGERLAGARPRWSSAAMLPLFAGNYALTVGSEIAIFVIFAASLHFLMSVGGLASFGHAAYFGLGAYGVAFLAKMAGLPMIVSLLLGPLLGPARRGGVRFLRRAIVRRLFRDADAGVCADRLVDRVPVGRGDRRRQRHSGRLAGEMGGGPGEFLLAVARRSPRSRSRLLRIIVFSPFGFALRATRDSPLRSEAIGINGKRVQWTAFVIAGTVAGIAGALFAYLKGSVFPDSLGISLSVDALVMVLLGGVETVSGAVIGAIVYKALNIWLVSQTDLSKLVLGGFIVLIVVAFPKGIVGMLETIRNRRRSSDAKIRARSPPGSRPPNEHGPHIAVGRRPEQILWRRSCRARRVVRAARRRNPGADRAQRRRQEHLLRHAQRPEHSGQRPDQSARRGHRGQEAARDLAARRRAHLPDHRDVPDHDRARERAGRAGVVWPAIVQSLGLDRADTRASEAGRLLDLVGMGAYAERPCGELAYGDLKRLELAIALANQPKLLLMDEPTAGMAPRERIELMRLTARIAREQSIGVLFTEHDMDVVFEHADRILVLNRGSLIAEGSPEAGPRQPAGSRHLSRRGPGL